MPINFPSSPTLNQTYTVGTKTWVWNGYAWVIQSIVNNVGATDNLARAAYDKANGSVQTGFTTITANTISITPSSNADTLTISAGNNITIDANSTTKTIIIASTASGGGGGDGPLAQAAFDTANTAASNTVYLQTVNNLQNTNITAVNTFAQAAYNQANTGGAPTTVGIQTDASYFPIFVDANNATATAETLHSHANLNWNPSAGNFRAPNFGDGTGAYNVNLGSGGTEGRGVVAGYSGGAYGGIGYNIRHTTTSNLYTAPSSDTVSYLRFDTGGFTFISSPNGTAGRSIAAGNTVATLTSAGVLTANQVTIGTGGSRFSFGNNARNLYLTGGDGTEVGLSMFDSAGTHRVQIYGSSTNYGFLDSNWGGWDIRKVKDGDMFLNGSSTYYIGTSDDNRGTVYVDNWFRNYSNTGLYNQTYARGIWAAEAGGNTYGNYTNYDSGRNGWQGWGLLTQFAWMARSGTDCGLYNTSFDWILYHTLGGLNGYRTSTTSASFPNYFNGSVYSTATIQAASDVRSKKDIKTISNAMEKITQLRGVTYKRTDFEDGDPNWNKTHMGVIAQEVEPIVPEVVSYAEDVDKYAVSYGNFAGLFIEAFKEQNNIINDLKAEIEKLKLKLGE